MNYMITAKGRAVLRSATLWGLSGHLRDLLVLCDPQVRLDHARQFMPPASLQAALFSLLELELIEGPPSPAPDTRDWEFSDSTSRRMPGKSRDSSASAARSA